MVGCRPEFQVVRFTAGRFLGGSLVGKANPTEGRAKRLHDIRTAYSFYLFNPGKTVLGPDSSQPGKAGNCGSMSTINSQRHREGRPGVNHPSINLRL